MTDQTPVLEIEGLAIDFEFSRVRLTAVSNVSLELQKGEILGLIGESGCGKSLTALAILGLVPFPGRIAGGQIRFHGRDLTLLDDHERREVRGDRIAMIFQDPMVAMNPSMTVGDQVAEPLILHRGVGVEEAHMKAAEMLRRVHIPAPEERIRDYPHQFSGGMLQRAMIAMALICQPEVLIADEPTTALDVTIQAQLLELLQEIRSESQTAILLITHDLSIIAETCDRTCVMYAGEIVETAPVEELFDRPGHPYTQALLAAIPDESSGRRLRSLEGQPPPPQAERIGCSFAPRCPIRIDRCLTDAPPSVRLGEGHWARCWKAEAG